MTKTYWFQSQMGKDLICIEATSRDEAWVKLAEKLHSSVDAAKVMAILKRQGIKMATLLLSEQL